MVGEQKIEPLQGDLAAHTEKQRNWVRGHFILEAQSQYESIEAKLRLLDTIISSKWILPDETWKLQSLGITFGDALAQKLNLEWVSVTDESDTDPALRCPGTDIILFPLTAISKRIENGEGVDVRDLFEKFCGEVERFLR